MLSRALASLFLLALAFGSEACEALLAVVIGIAAADVLFDGLDGARDVVPLMFE